MAARAVVRRALSLLDLANDVAAAPARLPGTVVDPVALLEIPGVAVGADEVAQGRAAGADRCAQGVLDRGSELGAALERELSRRGARMDAGEEQALVRVDVADTDDAPAVHQERLDAGAVRPRELVQPRRMQRARQRLDAKVHEQRMRIDVRGGPQHRAEAARVAQAKNPVA